MAISFGCPSCKRRLRVKDELAGKRGTCPGCSFTLTIPFSSEPLQAVQPTAERSSLPARLIAGGCILYAAAAIGTPLCFSPFALAATWTLLALLLLSPFVRSLRKNSLLLGMGLIVLVAAVNVQVYSAGGPGQFRTDIEPAPEDWAIYLGIQTVHGFDVIDYLPESEFKLEEMGMQPSGTQAKLGAVALRGAVSFFLVGTVLSLATRLAPVLVGRLVACVVWGLACLNYVWGDQGKAVILLVVGTVFFCEAIPLPGRTFRIVRLVTVIMLLLVIGVSCVSLGNYWQPRDYLLWPLDNVIRLLDFADVMQVFGWRLDSVEWRWRVNLELNLFEPVVGEDSMAGKYISRGFGEACGLLFRSIIGLYVGLTLNYLRLRWLNGLGLDPQALAEAATDPNPLIANAAVDQLKRLGARAKDAMPVLFASLPHIGRDSLLRVLTALNAIHPSWRTEKGDQEYQGIVDRLVWMVKNYPNPNYPRKEALEAAQELGRFGPAAESAIPVLTEKLTTPDRELRAAAAKALKRIDNKAPGGRGGSA